MLITNIFGRHKKDVYQIEWVDDTCCLGLFKNKPSTDKYGNKYYSVDDVVYLEKCCSLSGLTYLTVCSKIAHKRIRAYSVAHAVGKFKRFIELSREAVKEITCGL